MPNRYVEFVKDFSEKNNISWNCAVCKIQENNLYKPLNKKQQKEEEKKKDEELSEKILSRSINSFKKDMQKLNLTMIFIMLNVLFLIEVKNFKKR